MKYTLDEIKEMLLEPSFDIEARMCRVYYGKEVIELIEQAIKHHEDLDNNIIDGEKQ